MRDIEDIKRMNDEAVAKASVDKAIAAALKEGEHLSGVVDALRRSHGDGVAISFLSGYELALNAMRAQRPNAELRAYVAGFLLSGVARFAPANEAELWQRATLALIGGVNAADRFLTKPDEEVKQAA